METKFLKKSICMTFGFMLIFHLLAAKDTVNLDGMDSLIYSGNYSIKVTQIEPSSASTVQANTIYTLTIRNDSVYSDLPYFGRAYTVNYNQNNGLEMETSITDYSVIKKDKGMKEARFVSRTINDTYKWLLRFENDGTVQIQVSMSNKQPIRFVGTIRSPKL